MKNIYFLIFIVVIALTSCNSISDKPVSEKLSKKNCPKQ